MVEIGLKHYEPDDIPRMLAARDRRAGGSTAPPQGLILKWIKMKKLEAAENLQEGRPLERSFDH